MNDTDFSSNLSNNENFITRTMLCWLCFAIANVLLVDNSHAQFTPIYENLHITFPFTVEPQPGSSWTSSMLIPGDQQVALSPDVFTPGVVFFYHSNVLYRVRSK